MLNLQKALTDPKRRTILIMIAIIIIVFVGFLLYYLPGRKKASSPVLEIQPTAEETKRATVPDTLYNLTGTIAGFEEGAIVFEAKVPLVDDEGKLDHKIETRKILITSVTKFTSLIFVVNEETGKEIPTEVKLTIDDFEIGDIIEVLSIENISKKEEFRAIKIRLHSSGK